MRTMHFSMNFWANFTDILKVSLEELGNVFEKGVNISTIRSIIYSGLLAHDQEQGNEITYNQFQVGVWLEDVDSSNLNEIVEVMMQSRILGNNLNSGLERNVKKSTKGK